MPRPGEPYYVTTPIYYVNGEPHLGHAYTTIAADVATRHARRRGADAFFLTGTDEHGQKVQQAAAAAGVSPKEWADPIAARFRELAHDIEATNDFFIRTTDPEHEAFVQRFVERMRERGDLYEGTYSGLYCTACEAFYNEDDLIDGRCPEHGTVPVFTEERNTFFRLSAYADALLERYAADPPFVLPQTRLNEVRSHVEGGLQDVSITRESVNWGVPLPWDSSQAIYVWIDALINYTSALTYARPGEDLTARLWPARWQLLGKDILRFHAVIWPAMLLSAGYELPRQLFIHGMLAGQDGHRMSKTRGNAMDYRPVATTYGPDALRYYLLREVAFGQDGGVGYAGMHERYHSDLANELGNLVSRSIAMVTRYRDGVIPTVAPAPELAALAAEVADGYEQRLEHLDFTGALERVWELVRALNRFVEARAPWELAKSDEPESAAALDETLATLSEGVRVLAVLLSPYLPSKAPLMLAAIGEATDDVGFDRVVLGNGSGRSVDASGGPLFPRVDAPPA
jgi:methionyl-tRNA synthetase